MSTAGEGDRDRLRGGMLFSCRSVKSGHIRILEQMPEARDHALFLVEIVLASDRNIGMS